jgi:hypothetical protein
VALLASLATPVAAHEVRPGYLELSEVDATHFDVVWKIPAKGDRRLGLYVRLPEHCRAGEPTTQLVRGAWVERWSATCDSEWVGSTIRIDGLPSTRTDVLARVQRIDGSVQTVRLTADEPQFTIAAKPHRSDVAWTYTVLGIEHILGGVDHLLFVLALLFLVGSWGRLVGTITAFTLAHSVTLAAATLGWVHVPQAPVEATIALSIVFVAAELLRQRLPGAKAGLAERKPWLVALAFGLLHGLGFAGALREVGLPEQEIPLALTFFNVGVELGQIAFVTAVFAALGGVAWLRTRLLGLTTDPWQLIRRLAPPAAYAIGALATFWLLDRTASFWTT